MSKYTDEQVNKKLQDPKFFIERLLFIIDKQRRQIPFKFNPPQEIYYANRTNNDLILKSRKEGFSSLIEAMFLHACIYGKNENCVTMAHTWDDTVIHMDRVKFYLETMGLKDVRMSIELDKENQRELFFPKTNSRYWIGTAGSAGFGRGRDITRLHLSEVAHYADQGVLTGVMEACVPNAYKVLETTANGVGEAFYNLWMGAEDPLNNSPWKQHFFSWFQDPTNRLEPPETYVKLSTAEERMQKQYNLDIGQVLWYRQKRSEMADKEKMPQEHPSSAQEAFLRSGRPVFNLDKIAEKKSLVVHAPHIGDLIDNSAKIELSRNPEGFMRIWKMPRLGRSYLVAADVSEGVQGGDWSVAQVVDRSSWEQVATWRGRVSPGDFGRILCSIGTFYNNAVLVPELNNHGWAVVEAILAEKYKHLLKTTEMWPQDQEKHGFPTNEKTRAFIITALRHAIDNDTVYINDIITLKELETFIQNEKTGKLEAQAGCHDDCVMSLGIAIYCLRFLTVDETYAEHEKRKMAISSIGQLRLNNRKDGESERRSATGYR